MPLVEKGKRHGSLEINESMDESESEQRQCIVVVNKLTT
jgi:hypothetical protein